MPKYITAESVTEGHPDKLADRISDSILDAILAQDPQARVAAEVILTTGLALITGEITCQGYIDFQQIVRDSVREVGYTNPSYGFDADYSAVLIAVKEQSPDIAQGVLRDEAHSTPSETQLDSLGAGDQGIMFGYACNETPELMPLPISLAHQVTARLAALRKDGTLAYLRPDGKAQVTIAYEHDRPAYVDTVVVSSQHDPEVEHETLSQAIIDQVIKQAIPAQWLDTQTRYLINPTGRFVIGGPQSDAGLTGRKIIVDTYGGGAPHGGGAFSGKDPTKVDRSASYYARYIAKHIVAAGLAERCLVQLAYAIGVVKPVGMYIDTQGTGSYDDRRLEQCVAELFDARPAAIIQELDLRRPIYKQTSSYGHFGREGFPWEATPKLAALKEALAR